MKFLVTLNDEQDNALEKLMSEDLATNRTAYLAMLIGAEAKRREEVRNKRPVGRPRKEDARASEDEYESEPDYSQDKPKNILHFGRMIGKREFDDIQRNSESFAPQG